MTRHGSKTAQGNRFRVIGGRWRGRRLTFPAAGGVRPTPDRVRETLFNWLSPIPPGSRALDLFAGSGALGIEALSRGFAAVGFVERDRRLAAAIQQHLATLSTEDAGRVMTAALPGFLRNRPADFDPANVVFLDPPYDAGLHEPVLQALIAGGWLAEDAQVYIEYRNRGPAPLPAGWTVRKSGTAGDVAFALLEIAHEQAT